MKTSTRIILNIAITIAFAVAVAFVTWAAISILAMMVGAK